jgi:hypothetical protein
VPTTPAPARRLLALALLAPLAVGLIGCAQTVPGQPAAIVVPPDDGMLTKLTPADRDDRVPGADAEQITWVATIDTGTGVRTSLPGPVESTTLRDGTTQYLSTDLPPGIREAGMQVIPQASDAAFELDGFAEQTAARLGGKVDSEVPRVVDGHPAVDVRLSYPGRTGEQQVVLFRTVDTPRYAVLVAVGAALDSTAGADTLIARMAGDLQVPPSDRGTTRTASQEELQFREWEAAGWVRVPWSPVTDPASGVTAYLLGAAVAQQPVDPEDPANPGVYFTSDQGPDSVVMHFLTRPTADGQPEDPTAVVQLAADNVQGTVTSTRPTTIAGYPALVARIDFAAGSAGRAMMLAHVLHVGGSRVVVWTSGSAESEEVVGQVQELAVQRLQLP